MAKVNMYRNFVKFGHVVFEICEQTDRQSDIQTDMLYSEGQ